MADDARRLIADGRFVDAMDVLEAGAEPTQESLFWINLLDAARYLGYADRATTFYRRYRLSSPKAQTHRVVEETVRSDCSVSEGMRRVIGQCAKTTPDPGWDQFAHLPLDTELARLGKWLTALLSREPPPFEIGALRFGLVNIDRGGLPSADMYLAGVVQDDDDPEWALGPSSWEPTEPYGHSDVLAQIYRLSCAGDVFSDAEYALCLAYGGLALRFLATSLDPELLCGARGERVLAAGFDEGDGVVIGTVSRSGLIVDRPHSQVVKVRAITKPVAALVADLVGTDPGKRHKALLVFGGTYPADRDAVPGLVAALSHSDSAVRINVTSALEGIGRAAEKAIPKLTTLLRDRDAVARQAAAKALASIGGPAAGQAVPRLAEMMRTDPLSAVRRGAVEALCHLAEDFAEAIPPLADALRDPDSMVRYQAVIAFKLLGPRGKQALPALQSLAAEEDEDDGIRSQARTVVEMMTDNNK